MSSRAAPSFPPLVALASLIALSPFVHADAGLGFTDSPRPLVRDGKFRGKIYVSSAAQPLELESAAYLAGWILRVTGAHPEVVTEAPDELGAGIYVGETDAAKKEGVRPGGSESRDNFIAAIRSGDRLFLLGESSRATRFAVADFVKERLGVTFVCPGDFGTDWKPLRLVTFPEADRTDVPAFAWRQFSGLNTPAEKAWALDEGLGEIPQMNHALWDVFDAKAFAENPAMFPMRGGRRTAPSGRGGLEPQPDLANPDTAKYAAKRALAFFKKNPEAPAFSLSINDNMTWDDSPESKAAMGEGKWFRNRPDYSDYVFGFMNRAAEALYDEETEAIRAKCGALYPYIQPLRMIRSLTAYAYYHCENTPSFRVNPGVFPILTADRSEWRDPAFAAEDAALMDRWAASGAHRFGVYDYYYGTPMLAPRVFFKAESASIRHAAKDEASLFFAELEPDWGFDGPKAWLAAELTRHPEADADRLLGRYFDAAYGDAAEPMRRFFTEAESCWDRPGIPPLWIRFYFNDSVCELFPIGARRRMRSALLEAERTFARETPFVSGDVSRRERRLMRVRMTSLSFAKFEALADWYERRRSLDMIAPATSSGDIPRIAALRIACEADAGRYFASVEKWNACALNPGVPVRVGPVPYADAASMAALKTGAFAAAIPGRTDVDLEFRDMAAVLAEVPSGNVRRVFRDSFESDSFREATSGTWAAAKKLTIPRTPWSANLFEAEHTRFGFSPEGGTDGSGSLTVAGGDLAKIMRTDAFAAGDMCGVRVRYRGKIIPGTQVLLSLAFLDSQGRELAGGGATPAFPGAGGGWRTLALARRAPPGTSAVMISLRITGQVASDSLDFDDFEMRRLPSGR